MLDDGVRPRINQAGVAVLELDQVWRLTSRSVDFDYLAYLVRLTHDLGVDMQAIAHYGMHVRHLLVSALRPPGRRDELSMLTPTRPSAPSTPLGGCFRVRVYRSARPFRRPEQVGLQGR
jgi:hypothetical protein